MNKPSKELRARNTQIQARFIEELRKTQSPKDNRTIMQIYASLANEFDLSIERIREIAKNRRI